MRATQTRLANIDAATALSDSLSTSLGPRGADKMITDSKKKTIVTNDGATILSTLGATNPILRVLTSLSETQDRTCGDGTTTVVVLAGALLHAMRPFVERGVHPNSLCAALDEAKKVVADAVLAISSGIGCGSGCGVDRRVLVDAATTTLSSKAVGTSPAIAGIAVDAVLATKGENKIKVVHRSGCIDDTTMVRGFVLKKPAVEPPRRSRIALLQCALSAPKTNIDSRVLLSDPAQMERVVKEERNYVLGLCKSIKRANIDIVVVQKSFLREGVSTLASHFLSKMGVAVVADVERGDIECLSEFLNLRPVTDVEFLEMENTGAENGDTKNENCKDDANNAGVKECGSSVIDSNEGGSVANNVIDNVDTVAVSSDTKNKGGAYTRMVELTIEDDFLAVEADCVTVVIRCGDNLVADEAERSLNDALWVVRALYSNPSIVPGGGTVEGVVARALMAYAEQSVHSAVLSAVARAFESIPFYLARNAGCDPISLVHAVRKEGKGINCKLGAVSDMVAEGVVQPTVVSLSACGLAIETVMMILMVDDVIVCRN